MGLDTTHDCWHGPYSAFMRWRKVIARAAGIPLMLMEGFWDGAPPDYAMDWGRPREGGPACKSPNGPFLVGWIERVADWLPVRWESLRPDPIHVLLNHPDCDGVIESKDCGPVASRLAELWPLIPAEAGGVRQLTWREATQKFIDGLRAAAAAGEDVEFH